MNGGPCESANISELCMCVKGGCKYRKCVDSDAAWWPHCAAAWYEPAGEACLSTSATITRLHSSSVLDPFATNEKARVFLGQKP